MENASKALIMAAGILVGVMILTIAVTLFKTFSDFGNETYEKVEAERLAQWNNIYLKYYGFENITVDLDNNKSVQIPIQATAHDIITLANHARENNKKYEIEELPGYDESSFYIQVDVDNIKNLEKKDENYKNFFIKTNDLKEVKIGTKTIKVKKLFKVVTEPIISQYTKKVIYIKFTEYQKNEYLRYYNDILGQEITID